MGYSQGPKETILVADPILFNLTIAGFYGILWPHSPQSSPPTRLLSSLYIFPEMAPVFHTT